MTPPANTASATLSLGEVSVDTFSKVGAPLRHASALTRLGEATHDRGPLDAALREVGLVLDDDPRNAEAWVALGRVKLVLHHAGFPAKEGPYHRLGMTYLAGATEAFVRALQADPADSIAATLLSQSVLERRADNPTAPLAVLRRAATISPWPATLIALARVEHQAGEDSAAASSYRRYLVEGGDPGVGSLELSRTLFGRQEAARAESLYYRAASFAADSAVRGGIRSDLAWIATPAELASYDSVKATGVPAWLRRFWGHRDAREGRREGERLAEHYRRLAYAFAHFRTAAETGRGAANLSWGNDPDARLREASVTKLGVKDGQEAAWSLDRRPSSGFTDAVRAAGDTGQGSFFVPAASSTLLPAYHPDQNLLDDRGVIYIRYGPPDQRATYNGPNVPPNESWSYSTASGPLMFHFVGTVAPTRLQAHLLYFAPLYASRGTLDPRYNQLAFQLEHGGNGADQRLFTEEQQRNLEAVRIGTTSDAFPLRFKHGLEATVQAYGLARLPRIGAGILLTFAVRVRHVEEMDNGWAAEAIYPLRFHIVLEGLETGGITERDSLRKFVSPHGLTDDTYLTGQAVVGAPPGRYAVHVVISDLRGQDGASLAADTVSVPAPGQTGVTLSDVVLGYSGSSQAAAVGSDLVPLNPLGTVPSGTDLSIYYQVGGARAGERLHTQVEIHRRYDARAKDRVTVGFDDDANGDSVAHERTLSLSHLRPGAYDLVLTVRGEAGETVTRTRMLNVVDSGGNKGRQAE